MTVTRNRSIRRALIGLLTSHWRATKNSRAIVVTCFRLSAHLIDTFFSLFFFVCMRNATLLLSRRRWRLSPSVAIPICGPWSCVKPSKFIIIFFFLLITVNYNLFKASAYYLKVLKVADFGLIFVFFFPRGRGSKVFHNSIETVRKSKKKKKYVFIIFFKFIA